MDTFSMFMKFGIHFTPIHLIIVLGSFMVWLIASAFSEFESKKSWFWCLKCNEVGLVLCILEGLRVTHASLITAIPGAALSPIGQWVITSILFFGGWFLILLIVSSLAGFTLLLYLGGREALKKNLVARVVNQVLRPFRAWIAWNGIMAGAIADWKLRNFIKEPIVSYRAYKMMLEEHERWEMNRAEAMEKYGGKE